MQAHRTLYRKWRPQRFEDVIGQAHVVRTLTHALAQRRTAHAYLFAGPRGTGKTTLARLLAKGLNCAQGPTPTPCNECASCRQITEGSALDVMEIDGASNRGIDEIRELRDRIRYAPAQSRYKVYIIDEVHMLTNEAFNALLKMLEEPPSHVVFIFATTEPQRVPATILSRCQRFDFRRLSREELTRHLAAVAQAEGVQAEPAALELLARHADGGVRDALAMLEQCMAYDPEKLDTATVAEVLGLVRPEALAELALHFVEGNVPEGLALIGRLTADEGVDARLVAKDLLGLLRDAAAFKMLGARAPASQGGKEPAPGVRELAERAPMARLVAAMEGLIGAEPQMRWAPDARLVLELALMRLATSVEPRPAPEPRSVPDRSAPDLRPASDPRQAPGTRPAPESEAAGVTPASSAAKAAVAGAAPELAPAEVPDSVATASPAAPVSPPTPPAPARPQAPPLLLDEVQRRWGEVLSTLRSQQRRSAARVEALLREGRPIRVDGFEITIGFPEDRAFHRNAVEGDEKARQLVEKVCSRLFGRPVTVRTQIIDGESATPPEPSEPAEPVAQPPSGSAAGGVAQAAGLPPASKPWPVSPGPSAAPASPGASGSSAAAGTSTPVPHKPVLTQPSNGRSRRRKAQNGEDDDWDEATLKAVLEILGARIIREFEEPMEAEPDSESGSPDQGSSSEGA